MINAWMAHSFPMIQNVTVDCSASWQISSWSFLNYKPVLHRLTSAQKKEPDTYHMFICGLEVVGEDFADILRRKYY